MINGNKENIENENIEHWTIETCIWRLQKNYGKNDFAEISKNLTRLDLKIISLTHQNNYVERSSIMSNTAKSFDILATILGVLHNCFHSLAKLFANL